MKLAVIDIGSNSVRLMIWADRTSLYKRVNTTRLGEGIAQSGTLGADAMRRTVVAVADFYAQARAEKAERIYAFATAAVRSAKNGGEFCNLVKENCGLLVDVVKGEEEARLALLGALGGKDGGVIDIGGASTEVCFCLNGERTFTVSLDIGAVRLFDLCGDDKNKILQEINARIAPLTAVRFAGKIYAVGGTAATLASVKLGLPEYDAKKIQDTEFSAEEAQTLAEKLLSLTVEERKAIAGMDKNRADIIAGAALLFSEILKKLKLESILISDRDNLEGYLSLKGLI